MNLKESFYDGPIVRTLKHALSLLVVFLLLASTAVWTGRLFGRDNAESADFLQRAAHGTLVHWIGLTPQAGTHLKVDAVSGAT